MNLWQKLAWIQGEIGTVEKSGKPKQGGIKYSYVKGSDLQNIVREKMDEARVLLLMEVMSADVTFNMLYSSGNGHLTQLVIRFEWVNVDAPLERQAAMWYGQGADSEEKGAPKALSAAEKSFFLKTLHISTEPSGDDGNGASASGGADATPTAGAEFWEFVEGMRKRGYADFNAIGKLAAELGHNGLLKEMDVPTLRAIFDKANARAAQAAPDEQAPP
jgi:hypothetical protein